jgi:hypothetical protein
VYSTFNDFSDRHPWVGQENIRPKSIVREMFETYSSFADYVRSYDLHRVEGLLLRHINGVYKVLVQTVPSAAKNDIIDEMEVYLGTMIRQVDSSLLDEWEKMRDPSYLAAEAKEVRPPGAEAAEKDITRDTKKFTALVRARIFSFISALIKRDFEAALEVANQNVPGSPPEEGAIAEISTSGTAGSSWTPERLQQILETYLSEHNAMCLDPDARNIRHTYVTPFPEKKLWRVQQMLVDPDGTNDWVLEFEVDIAGSRESGEPMLRLGKFGSLV